MATIITREQILKFRTMMSCEMINDNLVGQNLDDFLDEVFLYKEDNKFFNDLLFAYERALSLCIVDYEKFKEEFHTFLLSKKQYIEDNNLYKDFFKFTYFIYKTLSKKRISEKILLAYQDLLLQQYSYLNPNEQLIYGVNSDNTLLLTPELFPKLDYPFFELEIFKQTPSREKIIKCYRKYGYMLNGIEDITKYTFDEQIVTNLIFQLVFLIDEETKDILPYPYYEHSTNIPKLPRIWKDTNFYKEQLLNRNYLLPNRGVIALYKTCGDIKEVLFKEKIIDNDIFLLYKIKFSNNKCSAGFYDTKEQIFFSAWTHGVEKANLILSTNIENFILENYWHLTCNTEITHKKTTALNIVSDINHIDTPYYIEQPLVQYITTKTNIKNEKSITSIHNFVKENYSIVPKEINPYLRKLPHNATISEQAFKKAKEKGIIVPEGMTYVDKFTKKVYRKK